MVSDTLYRASVIFLAVAAVFLALDAAEEVFAPLAMALVLGVVLSPLSVAGERSGLAPLPNAILVFLSALAVLGFVALLLEPAVVRIAERAPVIWYELRKSIADVQQFLSGFDRFSADLADTLGSDAPAGGNDTKVPSITDALLLAPSLAAQLLIFIGGLFFFLLSRAEIYRWLARVTPLNGTQLREVEQVVSRYFLTITVINAGFGMAVTIGLTLVGMPQPVLWGVIAAAANFILYLGPAVIALCLGVAGMIAFDGLQAVLPALVFVGLNLLEGQFVTPALVGHRMAVNPLLVFVSLVFWLWLWGPVGGIIAIPVLIAALAVAARVRDSRGEATDGKQLLF